MGCSKNDVDSFFNTGVTYTNNFSVSKSFENMNARLSYTNTRIGGIVPNSEIKKDNLSLNLNTSLSEKLKVDAVLIMFILMVSIGKQGYGDNSVAQKFYQWGQRQLDFGDLKRL